MQVYHVVRVAKPGHNTSHKTGRAWMDAFDDAESADRVASIANACRSQQCIGVEYIVEGPVDETVPFV